MTNVHDQAAKPMELGEALKDLGWLPILLMGAGGLSILDILEAAVYYDLSLVTPFQIALDGYRRVVGLIGAAIEPGLRSALDWLALNWQWHLRLSAMPRCLLVHRRGTHTPNIALRKFMKSHH